jgi:hypothetical protein
MRLEIAMHIVYWAHSYREEDAAINNYFGILIEQASRMIVNFDPPSKTVNSSKLEQNLRSCDGMVAVLSWRESGPSQYILYEIGLSLRARKPLVVFVDDRLPDEVLPLRVLQRRYSHRTYFRQVREHSHALRELITYMGDPPPPRYQPSSGQRACGLVGTRALDAKSRTLLHDLLHRRGYRSVELERTDVKNPLFFEPFEHLTSLDVAFRCVDSHSRISHYWAGCLSVAAVPLITVTTDPAHKFSDKYPMEFQPRPANLDNQPLLDVLAAEFDLYEQDFLKVQDPEAIERYTRMQVQAGVLAGRYEADTRKQFMEVVMGDQYNVSGQAGAVGPGAHAHDMTFTQVWEQLESSVDFVRLADELKQLRQAMNQEAVEPAHQLSAGAVAAAEQSARQKDGPKVIEYLKSAGKWALQLAEKIGVGVATAVLKGALGL